MQENKGSTTFYVKVPGPVPLYGISEHSVRGPFTRFGLSDMFKCSSPLTLSRFSYTFVVNPGSPRLFRSICANPADSTWWLLEIKLQSLRLLALWAGFLLFFAPGTLRMLHKQVDTINVKCLESYTRPQSRNLFLLTVASASFGLFVFLLPVSRKFITSFFERNFFPAGFL